MSAQNLRHRAEMRLRNAPQLRKCVPPSAPRERLVRELNVHEVELEMQMEDLRQAREESEISRRRYADLFEDAPVAMLCLDDGGRIVEANFAGMALLGVTRGDMLRKPLSAFMPAKDADALHVVRQEVLRTRAKRDCDLSIQSLDGRGLRTVHVVLSVPATGPAGECRCALIDVTELRAAEEARRAIHDAAPDAIVTIKSDGRIVSLNAAAKRLFLYAEQDLLGQSIERLVPPTIGVRGVVTAGPRRLTEGMRKDGSRFPMEIDVAEWRGRDQRMLSVICRDVSIRENALARLRETQDRFALITDHLEDALYVIDADGTLSYVSPAFERIWGDRSPALRDRRDAWPPGVHPDDQAEVRDARATLRRGDPFDIEYRIVRPDGTVRWIHDRATPIEDEHGKVTCIVGVARDRTTECELEIELRQAQKLETLGALSSGIAHDFNNVLQVVVGAITLAAEEDVPWEQASQYLQRAKAVAIRGGELVQRITGFARKEPTKRRPLLVDDILRDAATLLRPLLGEHIKLVLDLEARDGLVFATQVQLEQILLNLVSNSRDAMPNGGTVTLRSRRINDGSRKSTERILIELADTGSGMDKETKAQALAPFFTTKQPGRGTGLGLATVLAVTEQLGGTLRIDSEERRGTTVTIELPACGPNRIAPPPLFAKQQFHGTAFLVEDEPLVRRMLRRQLERLGFSVLEAESGPKCLELGVASNTKPDVLICDVLMPQITGPELASTLRERHPGLPILFISGEAGKTLDRANLEDKTRYLAKPFDPAALATELTLLLQPDRADSKPRASTLLVVDSDDGRRRRLKDSLAAAKMRVFAVGTIEEAKVMASSWAIDILVSNVRLADGPGDAVAAEVGRLHPHVTTFYVFDGDPPSPALQPSCAASDPAALIALIDSRYERQPSSVRTFA